MSDDIPNASPTMTPAFLAMIRQIAAKHFPYSDPPADATTVTLPELRCEFPDGPEAWTVRRCREWCARNCRNRGWIKWHFDEGYFTPVAYFADPDDAAKFTLTTGNRHRLQVSIDK